MCPRERHLPLNLPFTLILFRQSNRHRDDPLKIGSIEGQRSPARSRSPSQSQRYCFKSFTQTCAETGGPAHSSPAALASPACPLPDLVTNAECCRWSRRRHDTEGAARRAARHHSPDRRHAPAHVARQVARFVAILRLNHATVTETVTDSLTALAADPAASRRRTPRHIRPACAGRLPQPPAPLATTPRTACSRPSGTRQPARRLSPGIKPARTDQSR